MEALMETIELTPFQYTIRNAEIAQALEDQDFIVVDSSAGFLMQAPDGMSSTKARSVISIIIKLYTIAKEIERGQETYDRLIKQLEEGLKNWH